MSSLHVLSQAEITEIQRHFYRVAAETELAPDEPYEYNGIKFPNLTPFTVGPSSKFDIHGFARAVEAKILEKLEQAADSTTFIHE